jgi:hypothetical protein
VEAVEQKLLADVAVDDLHLRSSIPQDGTYPFGQGRCPLPD